MCHGLGPLDAHRGIVVEGLDPWTPCHASTSLSPIADSLSYNIYERIAARVWLNGGSVVMKLFFNWRSRDQSHPGLPVSHVLRRVWAPRVIVLVGMDPWTPCHASTSPTPVADSPGKKKRKYQGCIICNSKKRLIISTLFLT